MSKALVNIFDCSVPRDFQIECVRSIREAYREAYIKVKQEFRFELEEGHDVLPYLRRALIERNIRNMASRYPGVNVTTRTNAARNCHHNLIYSGKIMLTISSIDSPGSSVRKAKFRESYIYNPLFEDEMLLSEYDYLYAIICHGEDMLNSGQLGFVQVTFPKRSDSPSIDLLARASQKVINETETEIIPEILPLDLKEKRKQEEA